MTSIRVNVDKPYNVLIENSFDKLATCITSVPDVKSAFIITDSNVGALYLNQIKSILNSCHITCFEAVFPAGESSKNPETYISLINKISQSHLTRKDIIIALGGGVAGDMAGFCAATYLRGIRYIQIPTTLLAAVDSSVGGKTGVDLPAGKNLLGAFWQPSLVYFNSGVLKTLPNIEYKNGLGEIIKYAVLCGGRILEILEEGITNETLEELISLCVQYKRDVVETDPFEGGIRKLLNLGHTFGHAIEKLSNFNIPHGIAVTKGLVIALNASKNFGFSDSDYKRIINLCEKYGIDTNVDFPVSEMKKAMLSDKKSVGNNEISFVFAKKIGDCYYKTVNVESF